MNLPKIRALGLLPHTKWLRGNTHSSALGHQNLSAACGKETAADGLGLGGQLLGQVQETARTGLENKSRNTKCVNHSTGWKNADPPRSFPKNERKWLLSGCNYLAQLETVNFLRTVP